jgi:hypothetical protein
MLVASLALASATNANAITNNVETAAVEISMKSSPNYSLITPYQAACMIHGGYGADLFLYWDWRYANNGQTIIVWHKLRPVYGVFAVGSLI